jgi:hypothetical protein
MSKKRDSLGACLWDAWRLWVINTAAAPRGEVKRWARRWATGLAPSESIQQAPAPELNEAWANKKGDARQARHLDGRSQESKRRQRS